MRAHSRYGHKSELLNILFRADLKVTSRVVVGEGAIGDINRILGQCGLGKRIAMLCQPSVKSAWAEDAIKALSTDFQCHQLELPDGEQCKDHEQLARVWAFLQKLEFERGDCIVAIGGGALTDMAAFAASTYLRGVKLVLVPTTLLGQVDAAIGGKTGINLPAGKNLAGTFYFPEAVIVDPACLATLPHEDLVSGFGEIVKYALIEQTVAGQTEYSAGPKPLLSILQRLVGEGPLTADSNEMPGLIAACIKMKLSVVAKDATEQGLRRCLNLGHTLGHAVEKVSDFQVKHGQAVAIGLVFACKLAERLERLPASETTTLIELLNKAQLPTAPPVHLSKDLLVKAAAFDKKREGGKIRFVLPKDRLGFVEMDCRIAPDELDAAL